MGLGKTQSYYNEKDGYYYMVNPDIVNSESALRNYQSKSMGLFGFTTKINPLSYDELKNLYRVADESHATVKFKEGVETGIETAEKIGKAAISGIVGGADLLNWLIANWQIAVVGALGIIILIKRL